MKRKLLLMLAGIMTALCVTGCVKIIDKGTEGKYTGETEFDAASNSGGDWEKVVAEISETAVDLSEKADTFISHDFGDLIECAHSTRKSNKSVSVFDHPVSSC